MKRIAILLGLGVFFAVSCEEKNPESQVSNVSFTPCQQTKATKSDLSDRVDVEFTDKGVQISHYNFEVTCDFSTVNVIHTFENGVLCITQQGYPNQAKCICFTDVSYTISGILQNEVNVIFINGVQVYCYNENYPSLEEFAGIIMTTKASNVSFTIAAGNLTVDWGDDNTEATNNSGTGTFRFSHSYSGAIEHHIIITGDNIEYLDCSTNQLTALDVSRNTALKVLYCWDNPLNTLDVNRNIALTDLWCPKNQLTTLDVSKNTALEDLNCSTNQLTSLDVSRNTVLKILDCGETQLTNLDLSANIALENLHVCNTQITKLDVSANTVLNTLCVRNQLTVSALNDLFRTLPYIPETKYAFIDIGDYDRTHDCNRSIAEEKGWIFNPLHWEPIHTRD